MTLIMLCRITFSFFVTNSDVLLHALINCHYFPFYKIDIKSKGEQCGVFCLRLDGVQLNVANVYKYVKSFAFFISICLFICLFDFSLYDWCFLCFQLILSKTIAVTFKVIFTNTRL